VNYWEYIRVEELLRLQGGFGDDESQVSNDETLFIVVHQVYELWFKLILRELTAARDLFDKNPVPDVDIAQAVRSFKRVVVIFEQAAQHFRLMETLTTRDFLDFRDRLIPASGFQSAQMREIEILMGLDDQLRIPMGREGSYKDALRTPEGGASSATKRVEARIASGPSLRDVLYAWLSRTPIDGDTQDDAGTLRFLRRFIDAHRKEAAVRLERAMQVALAPADVERLRERYDSEVRMAEDFLLAGDDPSATDEARVQRRRVRAALIFLESYRELPRLAWPREVIDSVLELEQAMLIWRQRHARMVERVIGRRIGTGGSAGVDYLDQTALRYRIFGDFWAVRTLLLRKASVPVIDNPDAYRFKIED
jgi:tryptophan 2,3-dioxygenase